MVNKTIILVVIAALLAIGGLIFWGSITGSYVAAGGGKWYYGPQLIQMEPHEACAFAGCSSVYPSEVFMNEYGTYMAVCSCNGYRMTTPLVQTAIVGR